MANVTLSLLLLLFFTCSTLSVSIHNHNLRAVHVIFRHGDSELANPDFYPNNPEAPHEFRPHAEANLTNTGKLRSYRLGQFLRARYGDFLGEEYRSQDVYARSTYPERARASLLLALAGLYPPTAQQKWHPSLNWQPIPIESPGLYDFDPLMWPIDCSAYREERQQVENSTSFKDSTNSLIDFLVQLIDTNDSEPKWKDLSVLENLYRTLRIGLTSDATVPDWKNLDISAKVLRNIAILRYHTQNFSNRLRRLNGGFLLKKIIDDMILIVGGKRMPKINLYGGQEFNVVGFLWALDAWKPLVPTYGTAVILELWEQNYEYFVKVLYHDGYNGETEVRRIENCLKDLCPLKKIMDMRREIMPVDIFECNNDKNYRLECLKAEHTHALAKEPTESPETKYSKDSNKIDN